MLLLAGQAADNRGPITSAEEAARAATYELGSELRRGGISEPGIGLVLARMDAEARARGAIEARVAAARGAIE